MFTAKIQVSTSPTGVFKLKTAVAPQLIDTVATYLHATGNKFCWRCKAEYQQIDEYFSISEFTQALLSLEQALRKLDIPYVTWD